MVSIDGSVFAAIVVFLALVFALNALLFRPLMHIREEREKRTDGVTALAKQNLESYMDLSHRHQESIKRARMDGYQRQQQLRSEALASGAETLEQARRSAEKLIQESRDAIQAQIQTAKMQLSQEAQEIAGRIAATVLQRPV